MSTEAREPLLGQTIGGRYTVREVLGRGGMGTVYRATQQIGRTERPVAIKVLRRALSNDPDAVARFHREIEATCLLEHQNAIRVFDLGTTEDGLLYMVMEHLEGRTLAQLIEVEAPVPLGRAVHILAQVCDALAEAHDKGVVHRDLKPSNIYVVERHGNPEFVKVLDFGIAKIPLADGEPTLTKTGMLPGSPPYMSPEHVQGHKVDSRADIYSLGCLCFELLSGQRPYPGDNPVAVMLAHVEEPVPSIAATAPELELPVGVDPLLRCALAKDPAQRFPDALAFKSALAALLASAPAAADLAEVTDRVPAPAARAELGLADMPTETQSRSSPPKPAVDTDTQPLRELWALKGPAQQQQRPRRLVILTGLGRAGARHTAAAHGGGARPGGR